MQILGFPTVGGRMYVDFEYKGRRCSAYARHLLLGIRSGYFTQTGEQVIMNDYVFNGLRKLCLARGDVPVTDTHYANQMGRKLECVVSDFARSFGNIQVSNLPLQDTAGCVVKFRGTAADLQDGRVTLFSKAASNLAVIYRKSVPRPADGGVDTVFYFVPHQVVMVWRFTGFEASWLQRNCCVEVQSICLV